MFITLTEEVGSMALRILAWVSLKEGLDEIFMEVSA